MSSNHTPHNEPCWSNYNSSKNDHSCDIYCCHDYFLFQQFSWQRHNFFRIAVNSERRLWSVSLTVIRVEIQLLRPCCGCFCFFQVAELNCLLKGNSPNYWHNLRGWVLQTWGKHVEVNDRV